MLDAGWKTGVLQVCHSYTHNVASISLIHQVQAERFGKLNDEIYLRKKLLNINTKFMHVLCPAVKYGALQCDETMFESIKDCPICGWSVSQ